MKFTQISNSVINTNKPPQEWSEGDKFDFLFFIEGERNPNCYNLEYRHLRGHYLYELSIC